MKGLIIWSSHKVRILRIFTPSPSLYHFQLCNYNYLTFSKGRFLKMSDFEEGMRVQRELEEATQQHLLQFYEDLSQEEKLDLENDLKNLEIDQLDHMFKGEQQINLLLDF